MPRSLRSFVPPLGLGLALVLAAFPGAESAGAQAPSAGASVQGASGAPVALGSVSGRVVNVQLGAYLEGADVRIEELRRQTTTNREGRFSFGAVPAGSYSLVVTYLGLDSQRIPLTVRSGAGDPILVELRSAVFRLDDMVITGQIEGQAAAINLQRSSDNLKTIVSQDALGQIQEGNIGDALGRLPGLTVETRAGVQRTATIRGLAPQYNSVTVDGFTMTNVDGNRDIALDSYPSNTLSRVEVVRAVTPDMPGDAIGGTVNLVTRTAFDRSGRTLNGNVGGTFNENRNTGNRQLEFTLGDRFGRDGNLGALFTFSHFQDVRGYDVSNIGYSVSADDQYTITNNLVYDRDEKKDKYGIGANLDFRTAGGGHLYVKGMYNYDYRWLHRRGTNYLPGTNRVDNVTFYREPKNVFQMYIAGGSHDVGAWGLEYRAAYSRADKTYPETFQVTQGFNNVQLAVDRSNPNFPVFSVTNGVDVTNPAGLQLRNFQVTQAPRGEDELAFETSIRRELALAGLPASIRAGVRYTTKEASQAQPDYARFTVTGLTPAALAEHYSNDRFFRASDGRARLSPFFPDRDLWLAAYRSGTGFTAQEPFSTQGRANTEWSIGEDIASAFAMATVDRGPLRILGGLRAEHTRNDSRANEVVIQRVDGQDRITAINPQDAAGSYTNLLPGVHMRLEVREDMVVRASANRTISRPPPGDLIPSLQVNAQLTQPAVIIGNPDLVPATSTNLDLSAELYLAGLGLISAGGFYKAVDNFVFSERTRLNAGPFAGFDEVRRINGDGGTVMGVELSWGQQFSTLPGALAGFGVESNATFLRTEGTYPGREDEALPLAQSPSWIANLGVVYNQGRFTGRVSGMARSDRLQSVGGRAALDRYNEADRNLDFSAEFAARRGVNLFFHTRNLLDVPTIEYQGSPENPVSTSYYGRQFNAGMSLAF
ncbi:MAG: TonB-dependent receptor [Gemmatimonadales bacterium]|nr:MAG: TonB-dependent receptor [Gemmatimonadales bacterium]